MMNNMTQNQQAGPQRPGDAMEILDLKRLQKQVEIRQGLIDGCGSDGTIMPEIRMEVMNSWTGRTATGNRVHIHYHVGVLTVEVDVLTPSGTRQPVVVMRWAPRRAMAAISTPAVAPGRKSDPRDLALYRERARIEAQDAEQREIRAINGEKGRLISEGLMLHWLQEHHRRFDELSSMGLAGGKLRFAIAQTGGAIHQAA